MKQVIQCCFTRSGGQGTGAGWNIVNESKECSKTIHKEYFRLQNANIVTTYTMQQEEGNQVVWEVIPTEEYLYFSRIQYGIKDQLGRKNNMFAHGYVFELLQPSIVKTPNQFLTIEEVNFQKEYIAQQQPVEHVTYRENFTREKAMKRCGLNDHTYLLLLQCIYGQTLLESKKPLHLLYDGTVEQMCALLYCIYEGLPYGMRKSFSCITSNSNRKSKYQVVFTQNTEVGEYYYESTTGENNILPKAFYEPIDSFTIFSRYITINNSDFYETLEEVAQQLGEKPGQEFLKYQVALEMIEYDKVNELRDDALLQYVKRGMTLATSVEGDRYIAGLLELIMQREILMDEEWMRLFERRVISTKTKELQIIGEMYGIFYLYHIPFCSAVEYMVSLLSVRRNHYFTLLSKYAWGRERIELTKLMIPNVTALDKDMVQEVVRKIAFNPGESKEHQLLFDLIKSRYWFEHRDDIFSYEHKEDYLYFYLETDAKARECMERIKTIETFRQEVLDCIKIDEKEKQLLDCALVIAGSDGSPEWNELFLKFMKALENQNWKQAYEDYNELVYNQEIMIKREVSRYTMLWLEPRKKSGFSFLRNKLYRRVEKQSKGFA